MNMVAILMMSSKLAILDLPKIKLFWNKDYDLIISVNDVTKNLSPDSDYIVDVVMFGNCSISMREVIITSIS